MTVDLWTHLKTIRAQYPKLLGSQLPVQAVHDFI